MTDSNNTAITTGIASDTAGTSNSTEKSETGFADYVARELRLAAIRARLIQNAIATADLVLRSGLLGAEDALEIVAETPGALALVAPGSTSSWATTTWWSS